MRERQHERPVFTVFLAAACAPSRTTLRETESGAPFRVVYFVARLAKGTGHWLRLASRIPSRKAAVATAWDLIRGSLADKALDMPLRARFKELPYAVFFDNTSQGILEAFCSGNILVNLHPQQRLISFFSTGVPQPRS
ncbi:MAG: hypothetical protein ACREUI_03630, partial [Burkholderiales bacterium]